MSPDFKSLLIRWKQLPAGPRIIAVNVLVFLLLRLTGIIAAIGAWDIGIVVDRLALPSDLSMTAVQPWTVVTYMFTHYDIFHILFNMLALYWFGQLFLFRSTPRQLFGLYLIGGIAGAIAYIMAAQIFAGVGGYLLGASASIMAVMTATAILMPDFEIRLLFIGSVRLKWIAIGTIILFALGLTGNNAGGHVAHFGGIAAGTLYGLMMAKGIDITSPLNNILDRIVNAYNRISRYPRNNSKKKKFGPKTPRQSTQDNDRKELDSILDKIKKSGYSSLTADERKRLFDVSSRIK